LFICAKASTTGHYSRRAMALRAERNKLAFHFYY
jgi:hypothetical protein